MSTYISATGLEKLKEEYAKRKVAGRREIAEQIEAAKELGDLSENFEYNEAKERQAANETRLVELDGMINDAVIIEEQTGCGVITLGSSFTVALADGERTYQIVGSSEANPLAGKISNESPLGQAFIGRHIDDEVEVTIPSGQVIYRVVDIS